MGCGRAIVSTSYSYALEVLGQGRGLIAGNPDPKELAALILSILKDTDLKRRLQIAALSKGKSWTWPNVGKEYTRFFRRVIDNTLLNEEKGVSYAKL